MEPTISVIVPVYKVEPYLRKCVDSILSQTYRNLEIILVDDGSPDNCGAICDEYARQDARIKVIHKENSGLSDARNAGIEQSTGDYITFVDSDDWIAQDHIESMAKLVQHETPRTIVVSDVRRVDEHGNTITIFGYKGKEDVVDEPMFGYCWNKLYPSDFLRGEMFHAVRFAEDLLFNLELLRKGPQFVFTEKATYFYLMRENSILTAAISEKKIDNVIEFAHMLWSCLHRLYDGEKALKVYNAYAGNQLCNLLCEISVCTTLPYSEKKKYADKLIRQVSNGRIKWKYADHSLLRLLVLAEKLHCSAIYTVVYGKFLYRK